MTDSSLDISLVSEMVSVLWQMKELIQDNRSLYAKRHTKLFK